MLKVEPMSKIFVVGPDTEMKTVIKTLYNLGVMHIQAHEKSKDSDIGKPYEEANRFSAALIKIRSAISTLGIKENKGVGNLTALDISKIEKFINNLCYKFEINIESRKKLQAQIKDNEQILNTLKSLEPLRINLEDLAGCKSVDFAVGSINKAQEFESMLKKITTRYRLCISHEQKNPDFALFFDKEKSNLIRDLLNKSGFKPIDINAIRGLKGKPHSHITEIRKKLAKLEKRLKTLEDSFKNIQKESSKRLLQYKYALEKEIEKAEAPLLFGKTEKSFLISGYVPTKKLDDVTKKLNQVTKKRIFVKTEETGKKDKVPVLLKNPKPVKSFEFFMNLYTLPDYGEFDPTFLMFITFPLFFGFMLGDIGYGIVMLILFYLLKKKMPKAAGFFNILIFASLGTVFFGFLFGEFFGAEELFGISLWRILSREHDIMKLAYLAIAIGVVHINIGLIAGFFNILKQHGFKHAFMEKFGWIFLEIGVAVLALSYMGYVLPIPFTGNSISCSLIGYVILALAVIILYKGEGPRGIVEIPGIFGNILSYARLMAIGLSSVGLAVVVNDMGGELFHKGGIFIVVAIVVYIIGHTINIGIGILGSFLHSLRLHYVEFFSKFFKGGGIRYKPFGLKE